jgi:hypothetical protein
MLFFNDTYKGFLSQYLMNNSTKSNSYAENYLKFILSEKLNLSAELKLSLKNNFVTDATDISEIFFGKFENCNWMDL